MLSHDYFTQTRSMKVARIYLRVSTVEQNLDRQSSLVDDAIAAGFYVAGVYREKASGARTDRPELLRMIADLQVGDVVIAEHIDRISRLPLSDAELLIGRIQERGAKLAIPGLVDFTEVIADTEGVAKIVLESLQTLLLRLALQMARQDFEDRRSRQRQGIELAKNSGKYVGRIPNFKIHEQIVALRNSGLSIVDTARIAGCSRSQVKRIWALRIHAAGVSGAIEPPTNLSNSQ